MRLTLLICAAAIACQTGMGASPASAGLISGRVIDTLREPVPGVVVVAFRPGEGTSDRTETDREGRYAFTRLPAGSYSLDFDLLGFDIERVNDVPTRGSAEAQDVSVQLTVSTICECIEQKPLPGTLVDVAGRIVDVTGRAVAHAKLALRADAEHAVSGYSGVDGQFVARLSVGGTVKLTVSQDGFETTTREFGVRAKNREAVVTLLTIPAGQSPTTQRLGRACRCASIFLHPGW